MALCMCTAWFLSSLFSQSLFFGSIVANKYKLKFRLNCLLLWKHMLLETKAKPLKAVFDWILLLWILWWITHRIHAACKLRLTGVVPLQNGPAWNSPVSRCSFLSSIDNSVKSIKTLYSRKSTFASLTFHSYTIKILLRSKTTQGITFHCMIYIVQKLHICVALTHRRAEILGMKVSRHRNIESLCL